MITKDPILEILEEGIEIAKEKSDKEKLKNKLKEYKESNKKTK